MSQYVFSLAVAFLKQNFIAVLIAGTLLVGVVIWKVSAWKTTVDNERSTVPKSIKRLEDALSSFMVEIRQDIKNIFLRLPPPTTQADSPIKLSELGDRVAGEIQVDNWVDEYVAEVRARIGDNPTPYSIQDTCFQYAENELMKKLAENGPPERKESIEMSAYQNGIDLPAVLKVVGIKLRDQLLRNFNMQVPE